MNFITKAKFSNLKKDKRIKTGNFLIKKGKSKIAAVFDYKDSELTINKSNLKNNFLEGELLGKITLLPYFLGYFGLIYLFTAIFLGLYFVYYSFRVYLKKCP